MSPPRTSTSLRRFAGAEADEISILCQPEGPSQDAAGAARATYGALVARLAADGAERGSVVSETIFLRDVRRDLALVLDLRARALAAAGLTAPAPGVIEQAPLDGSAFAVAASAIVPRRCDGWSVWDVPAAPTCRCEGCAATAARLVRMGDQVSLQTSNIHGRGDDAATEAVQMFAAGEALLARCGLTFRDVVRTWIHLRDIDRDYDALNQARRAFFQSRGVDPPPASTGVQGGPLPDAHAFSLRLQAVRSPRPIEVAPISTPTLNEAWSYGADFSRGLRVVEANKIALHVSGTASIDEAGRTAHVGDSAGQVERMLLNIATLLRGQGATFADLVSGVVYLKRPGDAPLLRDLCRRRGFDGFPCALVEAPLCRPELLCEAEAVAMLPLDARAA
ncbi:MAG: hypothetical protein U0802_15185 [Candidatus Binatia bacterium]